MVDFKEQVSAAGAVVAGFAGVAAALMIASPPSAAQLSAADPLVQLAARPLATWAIPFISLVVPLGWWRIARPGRAARRLAARHVALSVSAVALGLPLLRLGVGPVLPAFIPPEESALPGMAMGLCAALLEEGVFRLGLLAPMYVVLVGKGRPPVAAAATAVLVTALALALLHEAGPGATATTGQYLASRFLILGCLMGALFLRPGPVFLVAGHCAAHLAIPLLFSGAAG